MTGWHGFALFAAALPLAIALPSPGAAQDGEGPHASHPKPAEARAERAGTSLDALEKARIEAEAAGDWMALERLTHPEFGRKSDSPQARSARGGAGHNPQGHSHEGDLDALAAAPDHHKILLENERVRVLDTCIAPGDRTNMHSHGWSAVQYVVSFSDFIRRGAAGEALADTRDWATKPAPGQALWSGPAPTHSIENVGTGELCVIAVELKDGASG